MNSMSLCSTALSSFMSMTHAGLVMRSIVNLTSDPIFTPGDMHTKLGSLRMTSKPGIDLTFPLEYDTSMRSRPFDLSGEGGLSG